MSKIKIPLVFGTILLFLGLALQPATAVQTNDGTFMSNLKMTRQELQELDQFLPELVNQMEKAESFPELLSIATGFTKEYGRHPLLMALIQFIVKILDVASNFNLFRPLRKDAFVLSWGFGPKFIPLRENKAQLFRPITGWYYSGRSNLLINSNTLIIDPYPFNLKTIKGRQIGLMTNFVGLYIYRHSSITEHSYTFFFGKTSTIRGFDFSPLNCLKS